MSTSESPSTSRAPQPGIIAEPGAHAHFLIFRARDVTHANAIARIAASTQKKLDSVRALDANAKLTATIGFGSALWDAISPTRKPRELRPFRELTNGPRTAPSTGGDLFLHLTSERRDLAFELACLVREELGSLVEIVEEVPGFRYKDTRDLTGFIDGTENPKGESRGEAALIGAEDPDFSGGSYVFVQRYVHDLKLWNACTQDEQEGAIGRTKHESTELSDEKKPKHAHIARVVIEEDGEELQIVRHSFPYGTTSDAGLFFVAYMKRLEIAERMLARMIGGQSEGQGDDGLHDRLMDYTRAVSGATFFAPSSALLASFSVC